MKISNCILCKSNLNGLSEDKKQAVRVDEVAPNCACETFSVGSGSPGPIRDDEDLFRLIVSPGDIDENTGELMLGMLSDASKDGLSIFRGCATNDEIYALVSERLTRKIDKPNRKIVAIARIKVESVRNLKKENFGRVFCVYDETVPRRREGQTPVPTHGTILQRLPQNKIENRNAIIKQDQLNLLKLLKIGLVDLTSFRDGIIIELNNKSINGDFDIISV